MITGGTFNYNIKHLIKYQGQSVAVFEQIEIPLVERELMFWNLRVQTWKDTTEIILIYWLYQAISLISVDL